MTRYFFDLNQTGAIEHDFTGQYLPNLGAAQQIAELIAMDLSCTRLNNVSPMEVQIRDATGNLCSAIPVKMLDALAA